MRINNNIAALNTYRQLSANSANAGKNMERLSSGLRINRAADDAAGLSISEKMRGQIRGLDQASSNSQDSISLLQTADAALQEAQNVLQRMRELGVQGANGTIQADEKEAINKELAQLSETVKGIGENTKFNGTSVLTGTDLTFQTGANSTEKMTTTMVNLNGILAAGTNNLTAGDTTFTPTFTDYGSLITDVDTALKDISLGRSGLGAASNRLEYNININNATSENLQAAESRIRDVDMAKEMMQFTKNNILSQAAQSMLAQANQQPQGVLQLLR